MRDLFAIVSSPRHSPALVRFTSLATDLALNRLQKVTWKKGVKTASQSFPVYVLFSGENNNKNGLGNKIIFTARVYSHQDKRDKFGLCALIST